MAENPFKPKKKAGLAPPPGPGSAAELENWLLEAEPMIEQVNNLYQQYIAGFEKRPPIERRKTLDRLMERIQQARKPNLALRFRANTLHSRYQAQAERWTKLLLKLESGAIKRRAS